MSLEKLDAFLSCSFHEADQELNNLFLALCVGLNIECSNVSYGNVALPADQARSLLEKQRLLIAICTRRDEKSTGGFHMPVAVRNEISMAYAKGIPIQIFVEEGVDLAGFEGTYGTYVRFSRNEIRSNESIKTIVRTLLNNRETCLPINIFDREYTDSLIRNEFVNFSADLPSCSDLAEWEIEIHKKTTFQKSAPPTIPISFWSDSSAAAREGAPNISFKSTLFESKGVASIREVFSTLSSREVGVNLELSPPPLDGDWIDYAVQIRSPYLIPKKDSDIGKKSSINIDGRIYSFSEGFLTLHPTKKLQIQYRIPRGLGINISNIAPVSINNSSGSLSLQEMGRIKSMIDYKGHYLIARIEIDNPMLHHMYGFAWNFPDEYI